jgi:RNA polymerase sigma-70 factor (ECF subfamily)
MGEILPGGTRVVAAFAENLIYRVQWGQARAFVALYSRCRVRVPRVVFFANRDNSNAQGWTVPTGDLIHRFQRGQPRAFEALYDRYKDYVYRTAFFVTRNSGDAEEAVQETFLDVLRALPHYRTEGPARFETWLYRVTVNRCRSRMRRKMLPSADWDDVEERLERIPAPHPNHDPEGVALRRERAVALWQAVDRLPEGQRVVVLLRYQQGFSYSEIAQTLDISEGTVKSRLYHAHRRLKERLQSAAAGLMQAEAEV